MSDLLSPLKVATHSLYKNLKEHLALLFSVYGTTYGTTYIRMDNPSTKSCMHFSARDKNHDAQNGSNWPSELKSNLSLLSQLIVSSYLHN